MDCHHTLDPTAKAHLIGLHFGHSFSSVCLGSRIKGARAVVLTAVHRSIDIYILIHYILHPKDNLQQFRPCEVLII